MTGLIRSPLVTNLDSRISILCWLMEVLGRKGLKSRLPWNGNSRKGPKLRLWQVTFFCCFKDRRNYMHNESKACAGSLRMLSPFWVYLNKHLFFSHFVTLFLQVSVTIWHLSIRERARKKKRRNIWKPTELVWQGLSRQYFLQNQSMI